jgi:hypothetical protein
MHAMIASSEPNPMATFVLSPSLANRIGLSGHAEAGEVAPDLRGAFAAGLFIGAARQSFSGIFADGERHLCKQLPFE